VKSRDVRKEAMASEVIAALAATLEQMKTDG
jgi:hypothetical protein